MVNNVGSTQLILTGSIAVDRIMVFPGSFKEVIQPDKLHVLSLSVLLDDVRETRGGVAANIAYNLGLLGEHPVLLGAVGDNGREYMHSLAQHGVDISHVHYSSRPTASFSVITDRDDCQVGGFYPGAMADAASLSLQQWQGQEVFVVVSAHDPIQMARQIEECQQFGLRFCYDIGQQVSNVTADSLRAGVAAAELLIVNDYEFAVLCKKTGWSADEVRERVGVVVITLGESGCEVWSQGQKLEVLATKPVQVVDPTGAGDAFRAGFLYGFVRKWDLKRCAQLGAVVASFALEQLGTQEHTFSVAQLNQRLSQTYQDVLKL